MRLERKTLTMTEDLDLPAQEPEPTLHDVVQEIHRVREHLKAMETRVNAKIAGVEQRLSSQIERVRSELKDEIASSYNLHEERIERLEVAVGE